MATGTIMRGATMMASPTRRNHSPARNERPPAHRRRLFRCKFRRFSWSTVTRI